MACVAPLALSANRTASVASRATGASATLWNGSDLNAAGQTREREKRGGALILLPRELRERITGRFWAREGATELFRARLAVR